MNIAIIVIHVGITMEVSRLANPTADAQEAWFLVIKFVPSLQRICLQTIP